MQFRQATVNWPVLHVAVAIIMQFVVVLFGGSWVIGAGVASGFFIGMEYRSAEYRLIERFYGKRMHMPKFAPLYDVRAWDIKSMFDWMAPIFFVSTIASLMR